MAANIRSDNRVPFASAHALFNLSKLAVWWLRLGIERIKPGHPQQNGRHERMHLTLQKETAKPAGLNFLQQQARFDEFIEIFNEERTHEALDMKCRAEVYQPATRTYTGLPDIDYPFHDKIIVVTRCRRICLGRKKINFSTVFAAKPWASKKFTTISGWSALWIMIWGLRSRTRVLEPLENPFGKYAQRIGTEVNTRAYSRNCRRLFIEFNVVAAVLQQLAGHGATDAGSYNCNTKVADGGHRLPLGSAGGGWSEHPPYCAYTNDSVVSKRR